jgi:hypothetical protein
MRPALTLIASLVFLAACSAAKPAEEVVAQIEERLAEDPCLADIKSLRRTYHFARRAGLVDRNRIYIDIQEAGHRGLPAGRIIIEPESAGILDDSQFFGAHATYIVSTGQLDIWACGQNLGGIRHSPRV